MRKFKKLLGIALVLSIAFNALAIGTSATIGDGDALTAVVNLEVYNTSGTGVAGDPYVATTPFSGAALNTNDVVMVRIIPQTDFLCGASRYAVMFNNALFSIVGTGKNAFTPNLANTFYDQVASGWSGATTVPSTAWPASIAAQASTYKAVCVANTADVTSNNGGFPALIPGDSWLFSFCIKAKTAITAGSGAKVWMDSSWFQTPADTTAAAYFAKVEPGQVYDPLLEDFRDRYSTEGSATTYNYKFDINDDISLEPAAVSQSTITFDSAGGSAVASITQDEGTAVTAPAAPTKAGFTFNGWVPTVPATMPVDDLTCVAQWTEIIAPTSTITFDPAGGSAVASITQDEGTAVTAPANPTKQGYVFDGWLPVVPATMPVDDLTCVAQWAPATDTIYTVNIYQSTIGSPDGYDLFFTYPLTGTTGTEASVTPGTYEGFTFNAADSKTSGIIAPDGSLVLNLYFRRNVVTITFNTDGGTVIAPVEGEYGAAVTAPADPTKAGFTFDGWDAVIPATFPAASQTINAVWVAIPTSTITFDSAGGSAVASITQDEGTAVTAPADPTKAGFTFDGWLPVVPATMPVDDMTCVAQWTEIIVPQSTISFDSAGGSAVASITLDEGADVTAPAAPTKAGFTFDGWIPAVPATMPVDDMTCVAQWKEIIIPQSTITFDSAGGSAVASITLDEGADVTTPMDPTKNGYTFAGWDPAVPATMPVDDMTCVAQWTINQYTLTCDATGGDPTTVITADFGTIIPAIPTPTKAGFTFAGWDSEIPATMPSANLFIYAQWTEIIIETSTIDFDSAGGSAVAPITQDEGSAVTAPADPTKAGFTFDGWLPAVPATMPVDDMTCVAQWTEIVIPQSTITFDTDGGSAIDPITLDEGAVVTAPADPTKAGFTFDGWLPVVPATMPVDDITCVAQWTAIPVEQGDVNGDGDITVLDALLALQGSTGETALTPAQILIADVNGDGRVSAIDALMILHYVSGVLAAFPVV